MKQNISKICSTDPMRPAMEYVQITKRFDKWYLLATDGYALAYISIDEDLPDWADGKLLPQEVVKKYQAARIQVNWFTMRMKEEYIDFEGVKYPYGKGQYPDAKSVYDGIIEATLVHYQISLDVDVLMRLCQALGSTKVSLYFNPENTSKGIIVKTAEETGIMMPLNNAWKKNGNEKLEMEVIKEIRTKRRKDNERFDELVGIFEKDKELFSKEQYNELMGLWSYIPFEDKERNTKYRLIRTYMTNRTAEGTPSHTDQLPDVPPQSQTQTNETAFHTPESSSLATSSAEADTGDHPEAEL